MGVHGLWKLIDSAGKPIPIETLENKVLAVDISIWLYQLVKGFQERAGRSVNNPFLLGLFRRICKLLFYRIKPVFVFDGGVPILKKKTIAARQKNRSKANEISEHLRKTLLENLTKQQALGRALGEPIIQLPKMLQSKQDTLFYLPPLPDSFKGSDEDSDSPAEELIGGRYNKDALQSVDISTDDFANLPADIRHDILTELKETRKQNSWANVHLMPENSTDFSKFQMGRLLKRRAVQVGLEKAEGEMGTRGFTISDIKDILKDQGVDVGQRIAADNTTRYLYASSNNDKNQHNSSPSKKLKICETTTLEEMSEYVENDSSLDEESINNINYRTSVPESLTQEEILNIIKEENANNICHTNQHYDINLPSTSKCYIEEELQCNIELKNSEKIEEKETLQQNSVNDQLVEHGNKLENYKERLKVEYENFSHIDEVNKERSLPSKSQTAEITLPETVKELKESIDVSSEEKFDFKILNFSANKAAITSESSGNQYNKENNRLNLSKKKEIDDVTAVDVLESGESSNPESDNDFLEVNSEQSFNPENEEKLSLPTLEIVVKETEIEEEDLFADVFREKISEVNVSKINSGKDNVTSDSVEFLTTKNNTDSKQSQNSSAEAVVEESGNKIKEQTNDTENTKSLVEEDLLPKNEITAQNYFNEKQLNIEEIINMKTNLEKESTYLIEETNREERIAATISEQTTIEAQELLRLFGLPYIVAPMEAEAQCAFLDQTGQTQGTITDDSDIWLFGATNVYKHFFDQKKFVKQFKASDIHRVYHLGREDLIMLAMLSGSDYTSGIQGIGPVNALEITAQFPPKENSKSPDQRLSRFVEAYLMRRIDAQLAKKLNNIQFSEGFPSVEVVKAYTYPRIDDSREPFSWATPNLDKLRSYTREKFGWDRVTADQTLLPVIDKLQQNKSQKTLHNYFEWAFEGIENKMSRRVERAVNLLRCKQSVPSTSLRPNNSSPKQPAVNNIKVSNLPKKSKTPAQVAREKAAKKLKEIRQREKEMKKQKNKKT